MNLTIGGMTVGEKLLEMDLTFIKSTGGTHVFGNPDMGIKSIYIPKLYFGGVTPEKLILSIAITKK